MLVTGGAGFIGSHLVDRLVSEKPEKIIVVDNFFLGSMKNLRQAQSRFSELAVERKDASDYAAMKRIIEKNGVDAVFDLAVVPLLASFKRPEWTFEKNVEITVALCKLLRQGFYDTLIHFSSSEVYGTAVYYPMDEKHFAGATTPYAASKLAGDALVLSYVKVFGVDAAVLRPFNNYGPRQNDQSYAGVIPLTIKRILAGKNPVIYGTGEQTRDYTFVTDTAQAALEVYKNRRTRGKVLNFGSGKETSVNRLVRLIMTYADCDKEIVYEKQRPGDVMRHVADISEIKKILGVRPKVSLENGLKKTVAWYLENAEKEKAKKKRA